MIAKAIDKINAEQLANAPKDRNFSIGDTVTVYVRIKEGEKERIQPFAGTVIAKDNGKGISATFTVRRLAYGIGMEKVFPVYSPYIDRIVVERSAKVRRAKLYYLRKLTGKKARLQAIDRKSEQKTEETAK